MKTTTILMVVSAVLATACGDALGPSDAVDITGTWLLTATPDSDDECFAKDLVLTITHSPDDTVSSSTSSYFHGTTEGGYAKCLSWGPHSLLPGHLYGFVYFNDNSGSWWLGFELFVEEQSLSLSVTAEIETQSRIWGSGQLGAGGVRKSIKTYTGEEGRIGSFPVAVTLKRQ